MSIEVASIDNDVFIFDTEDDNVKKLEFEASVGEIWHPAKTYKKLYTLRNFA